MTLHVIVMCICLCWPGNVDLARTILSNIDTVVPKLIPVKLRRIGLEIRTGNYARADNLYQESLQATMALEMRNFYAWRYARFTEKVRGETYTTSDLWSLHCFSIRFWGEGGATSYVAVTHKNSMRTLGNHHTHTHTHRYYRTTQRLWQS